MLSTVHIIRRRRKRQRRAHERAVRGQAWLALAFGLFALFVLAPAGVVVGGSAVLYWSSLGDVPTPGSETAAGGETILLDRSGATTLATLRDPLSAASESWLAYDALPPFVRDATLTAEDPDFLQTARFDPYATAYRLWNGALGTPNIPDASLTGRLVRNLYGGATADTLRETALVAELQRLYTPEELLAWHINTNDYGAAYGIAGAAQVYFGKTAAELTLDEAALLAAIPTAPQYNPFDNEAAARARQADLLRAMLRAGQIDQADFDTAISRLTPLRPAAPDLSERAPDYTRYAREQAETILDGTGRDGARLVRRGGLTITTALDLDLMAQSACTLQTQLDRLDGTPAAADVPCAGAAYLPAPPAASGDAPPNTGAVVVIDAATGELLALVGAGADEIYQPGVTLLPFVYNYAFRSAGALFTPATMVLDIPRPFPGAQEGLIYTPENADGAFRGPLNLRDAMGASLIPPAADVAYRQGMDNILRDAHQIGLNSLELGVYDLMLLERGGAVALLDVAYAYSVFAALGEMRGVSVEPVGAGYRGRDPVAVLEIADADGNILWRYERANPAATTTSILQPELAFLVNDILADQQTRWNVLGENNVLDLPRTAAVVSGVTGDRADNWTVGYTPQRVVGVWLGRTRVPFAPLTRAALEPMTLDPFGTTGAAAVWRALVAYAHERDGVAAQGWTQPAAIVEIPVCERSGMLPNGSCTVRTELFLDGTQTRLQQDTFWQAFEINRQTGQLATANTPSELRAQRVFFVPPPEAADWWAANNLPLPPSEYDTVSRPELFGSAAILQPEPFAYVGGEVEIRGSLNPNGMQFYQLAFGAGLNPDQWIDIGGQQTRYTAGSRLALWNTAGLNGLYNIRLNVVMADNTVETRIVQVTVDNVAPTLTLTTESGASIFRFPGDPTVALVAQAEDNLALARVEFYQDGQFLGADTSYPFGFALPVSAIGTYTISATAFDLAGNSVSADTAIEIVRAG